MDQETRSVTGREERETDTHHTNNQRHLVCGTVSYDVYAECPSCARKLNLNCLPYTDEQLEDYYHEDDPLGLAVFGTKKEPATWTKIDIEYKCYDCGNSFILNELEI